MIDFPKITLNSRYIPRIARGEKKYLLIDTVGLTEYSLTYPLFFILNQIKCNPISLKNLQIAYAEKKLEYQFDDLIEIIKEDQIPNLLVESSTSSSESKNFYRNKNQITSLAEYSPERVDFFITKYCNLKCKHCFESSSFELRKPAPIDLDLAKKVFEQMDYMSVSQLKITGGEVLTIPNFMEILELSLKFRFQVMILTNGILLNDKLIEKLRAKNVLIGLSLDGVDKETHEGLRGRGSFKRLDINLKKLKEAGIKYSLTTSVNSMNYKQIEEITEKAFNTYGAANITFSYVRSMGRAAENKFLFIDPGKEDEIRSKVENLGRVFGNDKVIYSNDTNLTKEESSSNTISCAAGTSIMAMDSDFNVYPCIYGIGIRDLYIGSLKNETLEDIWYSDKFDIYRGKLKLENLPECYSCTYNKKCCLRNCRIKPVFDGMSFYDPVSYCFKNQIINS
ncbi:radical SAM protein [Proteiniphilum sp.]|uniref:radical SAM protein n=1 Tax=Proteiniphilum sp. TaxID=1926877 RepID=UPI0033190E2A